MPGIVNEGANGFHLYTVVTDGYGNYVAEDGQGKEVARVASTGDANASFVQDMTELAGHVARVMGPDGNADKV